VPNAAEEVMDGHVGGGLGEACGVR
jgi:hypothetical protein